MDPDQEHRLAFGALPRGLDTFELLAAVGRNTGNESDHAYVMGYGLAAEQLFAVLNAGASSRLRRKTDQVAATYVDALVYPLGFCVRHYLELALKSATREMHGLRLKSVKSDYRHGLRAIWPAFDSACAVDRRLRQFGPTLKPLVEAVASVDPTGQTFRYRANLAGHVHLEETAVIHIRSMQRTFSALRSVLDELFDELEALSWEYSFGTYTDKLSRSDLIDIAHAIGSAYDPSDKGWMKDLRASVKQKYSLSNSEFDEADKLIEERPFLSYLSGRELPLKEVTSETMGMLLIALVAAPEDDLLSELEWAGLRGIVEVMRAVGAAEDYAPTVSRYLIEGSWVDKADIARSILRHPAECARALRKLGQPGLASSFLAAWPPHGDFH